MLLATSAWSYRRMPFNVGSAPCKTSSKRGNYDVITLSQLRFPLPKAEGNVLHWWYSRSAEC
jgi:hypothetical protein